MKITKLRLGEGVESAMREMGLDWGDLDMLIAFGDRREAGSGFEVWLDLESFASRFGLAAAEGLSRLDGVEIVVVNGVIIECRRIRGCKTDKE